jgi:hypothetical protein
VNKTKVPILWSSLPKGRGRQQITNTIIQDLALPLKGNKCYNKKRTESRIRGIWSVGGRNCILNQMGHLSLTGAQT